MHWMHPQGILHFWSRHGKWCLHSNISRNVQREYYCRRKKVLPIAVLVWSSKRQNGFKVSADSESKEWNSDFFSVLAAENSYKFINNEDWETRRRFCVTKNWECLLLKNVSDKDLLTLHTTNHETGKHLYRVEKEDSVSRLTKTAIMALP